jgi:hypothetical protein
MLANKVIKGNQQACILLKRAGNKKPLLNARTKSADQAKLYYQAIKKEALQKDYKLKLIASN